ncbi:hypothetical protein G7Z17_g1703 [Cylindrodendrum hubeiense]|uniref:Uncharacterized protein n=1 Tax=Cylindrodendrum hubeiense TaxID=595255 RepID=A0A9P5HEB6_9HYPO|nr:hypothetical protein G7Z17_g1703 [Cylindrodendrum hubeiense]
MFDGKILKSLEELDQRVIAPAFALNGLNKDTSHGKLSIDHESPLGFCEALLAILLILHNVVLKGIRFERVEESDLKLRLWNAFLKRRIVGAGDLPVPHPSTVK